MKGIYAMLICSALAVAGCEESKADVVKTKKPVTAQAPAAVAKAPAPVETVAPVAEAPAKIVDVEWSDALKMSEGGAMLVDVRTPGEVAEGMADGAVNIPLQEISHRLSEIPKDRDLLIYCRSGKRSMAASQFLIENGYTRVFNVLGGFLAYPKK